MVKKVLIAVLMGYLIISAIIGVVFFIFCFFPKTEDTKKMMVLRILGKIFFPSLIIVDLLTLLTVLYVKVISSRIFKKIVYDVSMFFGALKNM